MHTMSILAQGMALSLRQEKLWCVNTRVWQQSIFITCSKKTPRKPLSSWTESSETGNSTCFSENRLSDGTLWEIRKDKKSFRTNQEYKGEKQRARGARNSTKSLRDVNTRVSPDAEAAMRLLQGKRCFKEIKYRDLKWIKAKNILENQYSDHERGIFWTLMTW